MDWLALDIGGANLKSANGRGFASCRGFALWQNVDRLVHELRSLIAESPPCQRLAVTMTGELADCFDDKAQGVISLIDAIEEAADGRHLRIYLTDGRFVTPAVARHKADLAAASNWHALATFACRYIRDKQSALLIDVGSTTTDIVPLTSTRPAGVGRDDTTRLMAGELVYTGVRRSPVCAVAQKSRYRDKDIPLAQELFATMLDVYLILDKLPESPTSTATADGRPATKRAARSRLARMICADARTFHHRDAIEMARSLMDQQIDLLAAAAGQVAERIGCPPQFAMVSGEGEFLAEQLLIRLKWPVEMMRFRRLLGPKPSLCAPAHALAVLAGEHQSGNFTGE